MCPSITSLLLAPPSFFYLPASLGTFLHPQPILGSFPSTNVAYKFLAIMASVKQTHKVLLDEKYTKVHIFKILSGKTFRFFFFYRLMTAAKNFEKAAKGL